MAVVYLLMGAMVLVVFTSVLSDMLGLQGRRGTALFFGCLLAIWLCSCFADSSDAMVGDIEIASGS